MNIFSAPLQQHKENNRVSATTTAKGPAMNLRKSIKTALLQRDMSQKQLAEQLGMTQTSMSQLAAQTSCTGATLQKLAGAFGMKVSEFVALGED